MSLLDLPKVQNFARPDGVQTDAPSDALERFAEMPVAAAADDPNVISIYDDIGYDYWDGSGFTAKRCAAALRAIGNNPVTVEINSPGGDVFEGLAIYNLLREHPAKVTVKVMGLAASAASIIAMVGDEIVMGAGSFMMIHNAWVCACGNQNDLRAVVEKLEPIDAALADIYAARTGIDQDEIMSLLAAETWLNARDAVEQSFANTVSDERPIEAEASDRTFVSARRRVEAAMASDGVTRSERRRLMNDLSVGKPGAANLAKPGAGDLLAGIRQCIETLNP